MEKGLRRVLWRSACIGFSGLSTGKGFGIHAHLPQMKFKKKKNMIRNTEKWLFMITNNFRKVFTYANRKCWNLQFRIYSSVIFSKFLEYVSVLQKFTLFLLLFRISIFQETELFPSFVCVFCSQNLWFLYRTFIVLFRSDVKWKNRRRYNKKANENNKFPVV